MQATRQLSDALTIQLRQRLDIGLMLVVAALLAFGLIMVGSSAIGISDQNFNNPYHYLTRQLVYVAIGLFAAYIVYELPLQLWDVAGVILLGLIFVLLIVVLVPGVGRTVNGATRWINLGPAVLQVSELAKLLMILYMAGYIVRHGHDVRGSFVGFFKPMLVAALVSALLLAQPDYGAAAVIVAVIMGLLFLGGVRITHFLILIAIAGGAFAVLAVTSSYRLQRLMTFADPWADPFNTGFQLTQSLIAIGSGGWTGVGLGASIQKLFYLPEAHNDFVFAILAEELGFIGVSVVLFLFTYTVWRAFAIGTAAERAGHLYGAFVAYGVGLWIALQVFVNIGVNMGVLPTKGLTLPLMSAGGSSVVAMCIGLGLVLRVHREVHDLALRSGGGSSWVDRGGRT
ncbi:MAG: putative lipid II flippase FtsW [Thiotrichales bacterium]